MLLIIFIKLKLINNSSLQIYEGQSQSEGKTTPRGETLQRLLVGCSSNMESCSKIYKQIDHFTNGCDEQRKCRPSTSKNSDNFDDGILNEM